MRIILVLALLALAAALPAAAFDLGNRAPAKPAGDHQPPPPDPEVIRQGGDTFLDAPLLTLPVVYLAGTTVGYADDYDEVCPYSNSTSPDVVYRLSPTQDITVNIDMSGSTYDTKIYVYREDMTLVACNDDFYPDFVSKLENVLLEGDVKYFLVIDGYGGDAGDYVLSIDGYEPCELDCPYQGDHEDEPPLEDDYQDAYNGGCNSPEFGYPFQTVYATVFCGRSGWYLDGGDEVRDTDWLKIPAPDDLFLVVTGDAEFPTYLIELWPQDCANVAVFEQVTIGPCSEDTLVFAGNPGGFAWLWVGPTTYAGPAIEYSYVLFIDYQWGQPVATEAQTWSSVRGLFD